MEGGEIIAVKPGNGVRAAVPAWEAGLVVGQWQLFEVHEEALVGEQSFRDQKKMDVENILNLFSALDLLHLDPVVG